MLKAGLSNRVFDPRPTVATIGTREDARRIATMRERRDFEDSIDFRETRSLMRNTYGVCG